MPCAPAIAIPSRAATKTTQALAESGRHYASRRTDEAITVTTEHGSWYSG